MSSRSSHVRTKVVALLVSLVALWAFAAFVTAREGLNLLWVATFDTGVATPNETLILALQDERRLAVASLGANGRQADALHAQQVATDTARANFESLTRGTDVSIAESSALEARISQTFKSLESLAALRQAVDNQSIDRADAAAGYTRIIDSNFRIYDSLSSFSDQDIAKDVRTLISYSRARELLAQEDSLLGGVLAAGKISRDEHAEFIQLVGAQRFLHTEVTGALPEPDRERYEQLVNSDTFRRFVVLENKVIDSDDNLTTVPVKSADWDNATAAVLKQLFDLGVRGGDDIVARAAPAATWVIVRLALAGGLGLLAVIASIIISVTTARALIQQLEKLRNAASELASYRLPRVVERLQHGEKVDVDVEAPPLDFGRDEIGQVGQAFNDVQSTAIRVAVEQAELRRSVRDVFLSLARRSQALLHRQLGLLDAMERRATDAEELAELFRIDHLATRMRRNAENLIVLSGATAGRAWRKPVPMVDVLRGALAEVEDYTRVTVLPVVPASLVGRAVGDVIHLLAELIENAVSFSPPQTVVRVGGSMVGNGFAIEIEDRGLGMNESDRALANHQLNDPPEFKLSSTARLGLYVVGKLAERHGIRVKLTESPYGGTTAIVLLPATLMADGGGEGQTDADGLDPAGTAAWAALTPGRHRSDADTEQPALAAGPTAGYGSPAGPMLGDGSLAQLSSVAAPFADELASNGHYSPPSFVTLMPAFGPTDAAQAGDTASGLAANGLAGNGLAASVAPAPNAIANLALDVAPGTTPAATAGSDEGPVLTPSGLPFRQRDRNPPANSTAADTPASGTAMPPGVRDAKPAMFSGMMDVESDTGPAAPAARPPEAARDIMASYRSGTLRGRIDAARLNDTNHAPEWTEPTQESQGSDEKG